MIQRLTDRADICKVLGDARDASDRQLKTMRQAADEIIGDDPDIIVGVNGSIARREMTSGSDVDIFFLTLSGDKNKAADLQEQYRYKLRSIGIKMPAAGGVFESPLPAYDLASKIGGEDDTNTYITIRMLYLLEGEWIHNQECFDNLRRDLVSHYVPDNLDDHKLCRYFLSDVIRYWRTICVDFEFKTAEASKPRAIRLIKLRLSRMMLYFGGVAAVSETSNKDAAEKRRVLLRLLAMPPIDRLIDVFGRDELDGALSAYATFLNSLDCADVRNALSLDGRQGLDTEAYKQLSKVARDFRDELWNLLVRKDQSRDEIVSAILL